MASQIKKMNEETHDLIVFVLVVVVWILIEVTGIF